MYKVHIKLWLFHLATGVILSLISGILLSSFYALWGLLIGSMLFVFFGWGYRYEFSMGAVGTIIFSGIVSLAGSIFVGLIIKSLLAPTYVKQSDFICVAAIPCRKVVQYFKRCTFVTFICYSLCRSLLKRGFISLHNFRQRKGSPIERFFEQSR